MFKFGLGTQSGIHVGYAKYIWRELVFLAWRNTEKVPWNTLA